MMRSQFYTILDYQLRVLKDLEELEFNLYRNPDIFEQDKINLVEEAKKRIEEFSSYLEDLEKKLYPEE